MVVSVEEPLAGTDVLLVVVGRTVVLPGAVTDDCAIPRLAKIVSMGSRTLTWRRGR